MTVEDDRRQSIQSIANQKYFFFIKHFGRTAKTTPVDPIGLGNPLDALLVIGYKGVGDATQGQ
jgi:hypothetical protein